MWQRTQEFAKPRREGGVCAVPRGPLYVFTHVDTRGGHVESRKPSLEEAPPSFFDALKTALLEDSCGPEPLQVKYHSQRAPDARGTDAALPRAGMSLACASHAELVGLDGCQSNGAVLRHIRSCCEETGF